MRGSCTWSAIRWSASNPITCSGAPRTASAATSLRRSATSDDPQNLFVARSRYATQLERWLEHFPQEQVLVLSAEELRDRRRAAVAAVLAHVGLDDRVDPEALATEHHRSQDKGEPPRLLGVLPARLRRRVPGHPVDRQRLPGALRERLAELLAPEAHRLRALTGLRFEEWSL